MIMINMSVVIINMNKLDENKEKLLKYIINNVCSRNGYLTSKQVQSVVKLNKFFHYTNLMALLLFMMILLRLLYGT